MRRMARTRRKKKKTLGGGEQSGPSEMDGGPLKQPIQSHRKQAR